MAIVTKASDFLRNSLRSLFGSLPVGVMTMTRRTLSGLLQMMPESPPKNLQKQILSLETLPLVRVRFPQINLGANQVKPEGQATKPLVQEIHMELSTPWQPIFNTKPDDQITGAFHQSFWNNDIQLAPVIKPNFSEHIPSTSPRDQITGEGVYKVSWQSLPNNNASLPKVQVIEEDLGENFSSESQNKVAVVEQDKIIEQENRVTTTPKAPQVHETTTPSHDSKDWYKEWRGQRVHQQNILYAQIQDKNVRVIDNNLTKHVENQHNHKEYSEDNLLDIVTPTENVVTTTEKFVKRYQTAKPWRDLYNRRAL